MAPKMSKLASEPTVEPHQSDAQPASGYPETAPLPEVESDAHESDAPTSETSDETESEEDKKSNDGQEDTQDKDHDDKDDPSCATPTLTSAAASSSDPAPIPAEFFDPNFDKMIEEATSIDELNKLHDDALARSTYYWKQKVALKKILTKAVNARKKELRKQREEQEKQNKTEQVVPTLTIHVVIDGKSYALTLNATSTVKDIRDALKVNYGFTIKRLKKLRYLMNGEDMGLHARREIGSGKTGGTGWKMTNDSIVQTSVVGRGGGKRGRSTTTISKEEKINAKQLEMQMSVSHVLNLGIPDMTFNKQFLEQLSNMLSQGNGIDDVLDSLPAEKCKRIQAYIFTTNNETSRFDFIAKICLDQFFTRISQMSALNDLMTDTAKTTTAYALYKSYLTDASRMSWEGFRMTLDKIIEKKQIEAAQTATGCEVTEKPAYHADDF
ncbi:unnamed protein product [Effrenium voratum]|uniref:Ubiquitin-like domain-containing protein n=1 Tax=Effrenium voratum TaxID=2562239 RepID=A0AA36MNT2_9DINO|nr:unnamed protein product [Effrenium voratum]